MRIHAQEEANNVLAGIQGTDLAAYAKSVEIELLGCPGQICPKKRVE